MKKLSIAYLTPELSPFAKVGGLADVAAALPPMVHDAGHDIRIFMPLYGQMDWNRFPFQPVESDQNIPLDFADQKFSFHLFRAKLPGSELDVNFIQCAPLYERSSFYTDDPDEYLRFLFLSRAVLALCQKWQWAPDIFHLNDWQTAFLPVDLKGHYHWDKLFHQSRTLLTIHNLGYQGVFSSEILPMLEMPGSEHLIPSEDLAGGRINFLKAGLIHADRLSTVSPTYAREIQGETEGFGLHDILQSRSSDLMGILNGVDYGVWNPQIDPHLPYRYSEKSLWRKWKGKGSLSRQWGLDHSDRIPLVGVVSRLTYQKGSDLLIDVLPWYLEQNRIRLVVLGSGEAYFEQKFLEMERNFPGRVHFHRGFNKAMAHQIEAASDLFLMPSRYEPCGLNQMYSLKYGSIPVVRKTGGLADTVEHFDPHSGEGTGFVFEHYDAAGLRWALDQALSSYGDPSLWKQLLANAMSRDFSWKSRGQEAITLYESMITGESG